MGASTVCSTQQHTVACSTQHHIAPYNSIQHTAPCSTQQQGPHRDATTCITNCHSIAIQRNQAVRVRCEREEQQWGLCYWKQVLRHTPNISPHPDRLVQSCCDLRAVYLTAVHPTAVYLTAVHPTARYILQMCTLQMCLPLSEICRVQPLLKLPADAPRAPSSARSEHPARQQWPTSDAARSEPQQH